MGSFIDLTGQKFGKLTILEFSGTTKKHHSPWKVVCDCGTTLIVFGRNLRCGSTRSCGCLNSQLTKIRFTTHNKSYTRIYAAHQNAKQRCKNPKDRKWSLYGGRGIEVCKEWDGPNGFINFWKDMGDPPSGLSLDRINNDGNYEPSNCRWTDRKTQANNTRRSKKYAEVTIAG